MDNVRKRVKRRLPLLFIFLVLLIGIGAFVYPKISNWLSVYTSKVEISSYDSDVKSLNTEQIENFEKIAQRYNGAIASRNTEEILSYNYNEILGFSDVMGYVDIPKIKVYLPIYHGVSEKTLQDGIGHIEGTSLPIGGKNTHSVISGHTGLPSAEFFTNIDQLVEDDVFYIHILGKILAYKVDQIKVVLPDDDSYIDVVGGKDYVTLLTCTPYGINDHRLLVRGERIPYDYNNNDNNLSYAQPTKLPEENIIPVKKIIKYAFVIAIVVFTIIVLLILFLPVGKNKKKVR